LLALKIGVEPLAAQEFDNTFLDVYDKLRRP
jgi:hypothetical protein